jgi:hypothetical protein
MTRTSTATLQTIWDCQFSRPGHRLTNVVEELQPEPLWICIREGDRHPVSEDICQRCPHWELESSPSCR